MHFEVNTDPSLHADLWVHQGTERIGFRLPVIFRRTSSRDGIQFDLYGEINRYLQTLKPEDQQTLFDLYLDMKKALESPRVLKFARLQLRQSIKAFYDVLKLEDAVHWMRFHAGIGVPASVQNEYVQEDDKPYTRKMTYVRDDYRQLQALILVLRCMLPIWGETLVKEAKAIDSDWKEFVLYQLLGESALMHCEPMEKLRYYAATLYQSEYNKNRDVNDSATFSGLSSLDMPEWLLGFVTVRKVVVGNITSSSDEKSNLISSIHYIIIGKLSNSSQNFSGLVKRKEVTEDSSDDNNKLSVLEKIRKRFQLPDGEISLMEVVASDIMKAREYQYPWLPVKTLRMAVAAVKKLPQQPILPAQQAMAERILADRLTTGELESFPWPVLLDNLALAQALAWHRKHYAIAALLTASPVPSTGAGYGRLTREKTEQLDQLFPYHHRIISKQKKELQKVINPAVQTIELIIKDMGEFDWQLMIPEEWLTELSDMLYRGRVIQLPYDIRTFLADLIIDFEEEITV